LIQNPGGDDLKRREFLSTAAATATCFSLKGGALEQNEDQKNVESMPTVFSATATAARIPRIGRPGTKRGEMLYRQLGSTGEQVSVIGLGGSHLGQPQVPEDEALRLIHEGMDRGINFLDNAWDYNEGRSEERVGKALSQGGYRNKAFVMTKIDGRTKETATNQIKDSLKRLKVDHIDLLQHHEVLRYDDPDRIFNEGGSMAAVVADSPGTKIRTFICICWRLHIGMASTSIQCRCRSTSWMRTSAVFRNSLCRRLFGKTSAYWG
jgi:uncharacterized protein